MASYTTPILLTAGMTFANTWYANKALDFRPLLGGGIAILLGGVIVAAVPGAEPVVAGIAWIAFAAALVAPVSHPTPLDTLLKIINGK